MKKKVGDFINYNKYFIKFIYTLIVLNVLTLILESYKETKVELSITVFVTFVLMMLSSILMYYIEYDAQPEKFASIGDAVWWAVATLTTVG
jgi:L-cystine uptake protein TcyP (sodium:dicarboxylate symporter family)